MARRSFFARSRILALAVVAASCGGTHSGPSDAGPQVDPTLRANVVASIATNVIFPETQAFEAAAAALETALAAYAAAPTDTGLRDAARTAFAAANAAWQRVEVLQVGPLALPNHAIAGEGIRDEIYAWPIVSRCGIDEILVSQTYAPSASLGTALVNVRGMAAIEYLLYGTSSANACGTLNAINTSGSWAAIADLDARRAAYASSAATLVHQQATRLRTAWDPAGGNFVATISGAGTAANPYPSSQEALNGLSNALFYVDLVTKDMKVAIPAGISLACGQASCPGSVELPLSKLSLESIRINLQMYKTVMTGGAGTALGFDDLLVSIGQDAVATQMLVDIDAAIAAVDAITVPLAMAVDTQPTEVQALYDAIKVLSDLLKGQFCALLDLDRPMAAAGDND